jgi:predicted metalloprotease
MHSRWRASAVILIVVALFAACGGGSKKPTSSSSNDGNGSRASSSGGKIEVSKQKLSKSKSDEKADDQIIRRSIDDVETWLAEEYPRLYGEPYKKIAGGKYPYGPSNPPPECGGPGKANYNDVAENAFYCPPGDFVAWDDVKLTNKLLDEFGPYTLGIVVAHELGHGVQARHGMLDGRFITFLTEQQADCFAGAYTRWVAEGHSNLWELKLSDLDQALGGFLQIRDPVGTDTVNDASAHGSAFQRINAFEDGLSEGADRCKDYESGNITFVPETFTSETDYANSGNLPLHQLEPAVAQNLDAFWAKAFTDISKSWTALSAYPFNPDTEKVACGSESATGADAVGLAFYCATDDAAFWDDAYLMPYVWENIGDFANAILIANLYSERAQILAGLDTGTLESALQGDCFTGVWAATTATAELSTDLTLSPGDLDEAVGAFLQFSDNAADIESGSGTTGSAFQRLDSFRRGFLTAYNGGYLSGLNDCVAGGGAAAAASDSQASSLAS